MQPATMTPVPNQPPARPSSRRLAICGESPGADECAWHVCTRCGHGYSPEKSYTGAKCPDCGGTAEHRPTPFVGPSGMLLNRLLAEVGIQREACWVGNVCQVRPPGNEIKLFKWEGPEIQGGLAQLRSELEAFGPHMCLLLGNTPLRAFRGEKGGIGDWRGSLMLAKEGAPGVKCLATYHPAALLRDHSLTSEVRLDLRRLVEELAMDGLVLPERFIEVDLDKEAILHRLRVIQLARRPVSVDIEGGVDWIECIGFGVSAKEAFVVPFIKVDGSSVWDEADEIELWGAVGGVLEDAQVPKILQHSLYDAFVLAWTLGIVVRGVADDTMLKHFELYCEKEKSLGFQASVYTREPFYKFQRKAAKAMQVEADE